MNHPLARKKSSSSIRGKQSEAGSAAPSSTTPSDQKPREAKSAPYQSPQYKILLETKGSFMRKSELGIADTSKTVCRTLLEAENEAKVIQDIARLIVPSAQSLAIRGAKHLKTLIENYAVGFKRTAFTEDQLKKIQTFIGGFSEMSLFLGTYYMYFPFLTCEVKCGTAALDVADRQNAHSMTLAVRGTVELFRLVKREKELHREILAFSISHDHRTVRIYGHYPVIDGKTTTFYRYPILSQQSELGESGLSQGFESHYLSDQTSHDTASLRGAGNQSSPVGSRDVPSDTSLSQRTEGGEFKKPKKRARS
ncbi:phosphatidylserine decarboxylase protein [Rutstroemia sp. NJR-2017a BBW]|nr:phosphatidylserine decarboxylase protein [Rutstroemia sp. NJR-2017a BBW]